MAAKKIVFDAEARRALRRGVDVVANAIKGTLGPAGRSVMLAQPAGSPTISSAGAAIARDITLTDSFENIGAQLLKEATKTEDVHDGTTTAALIAQSIVHEGLRNVEAGWNPFLIKRGIDFAVEHAISEMGKLVRKVDTPRHIEQVASIAANDSALGILIREAMDAVGTDGAITIENSRAMDTAVDLPTGLRISAGYLSEYMATDAERREAVLDNPYVLLTQQKIAEIRDIVPLLEKLVHTGRPLLIVADDVTGEALATLVVNTLRGTYRTVAVKAPATGDRRKEILNDLAVLTGGTVISEEMGLRLSSVTPELLGSAKSAQITPTDTTIIDGGGSKTTIAVRVEAIRRELSIVQNETERARLRERLGRLTSGVAVIRVGAATETEQRLKRDRLEGALTAVRAAIDEGMVAGGGSALVRTLDSLETRSAEHGAEVAADEKIGWNIVRRAIEQPLRQIAENAGYEGAVAVRRVRTAGRDHGFDALSGQLVDMFDAGIVEPLKVTRSALRNAASVGSMILTTETALADRPIGGAFIGLESVRSRKTRSRPLGSTVRVTSAGEAEPPSIVTDRPPRDEDRPDEPTIAAPLVLKATMTEHVRKGQEVPLEAWLARTHELESGAVLNVPPSATEIHVTVNAHGFDVLSDTLVTLSIPAKGDSARELFRLRAIESGVHRIVLTAYCGGTSVGKLSLEVTIDDDIATGQQVEKKASVGEEAEKGRVTIQITWDPVASVYRYLFIDDGIPWRTPVVSQRLNSPRDNVTTLLDELNTIARESAYESPSVAYDNIIGKGKELWSALIPLELQRAFWDRHDKIGQLIICSENDPVPWELIYPSEPPNATAGVEYDAGFLGEQFPISRVLLSDDRRPVRRLSLRNKPTFVLPASAPPAAHAEYAALHDVLPYLPPALSNVTMLMHVLKNERPDLVHFACHNLVAGSRIQIGMQGGAFKRDLIHRLSKNQLGSPLIFMNACRTGVKIDTFTGVTGWAESFLKKGAAAFIGSLWEVRDETAKTFATEFYGAIKANKTLGDAVHSARLAIKDIPHDPTWLAYTLYGDPAAVVTS